MGILLIFPKAILDISYLSFLLMTLPALCLIKMVVPRAPFFHSAKDFIGPAGFPEPSLLDLKPTPDEHNLRLNIFPIIVFSTQRSL